MRTYKIREINLASHKTFLILGNFRVFLFKYFTYVAIVRLVGGPNKFDGRVEVYYNGEWGTVCDDGWDLNDAQVVCNELGYGTATAAKHWAAYGEGSGPIWLDDVNCVGTESFISYCSHNGWGSHNCDHREDASVNCRPGNLTCCYTISLLLYQCLEDTYSVYVSELPIISTYIFILKSS